MLTKQEKQKLVSDGIKAVKAGKSVAIIQLDGTPDRLLQLSRNRLRGSARFILGRKNVLARILEGNADTKGLAQYVTGTSAIVVADMDPFELNSRLRENVLRLSAKPKQAAPAEIVIRSQETTLQPGQAVTELKAAGIDVQIQKGKVVISKDKVIREGEIVTNGMAKALHSLNITPFTAKIEPFVVLSSGMLFRREVLSITRESVTADIGKAFNSALQLSLERGIVNRYTVRQLIGRAYRSAMHLGIECKLPDRGIVEKLIEKAVLGAKGMPAPVPEAAAKEAPAGAPTEAQAEGKDDAK